MLAVDEVVDHAALDGPGAVEGVQGDQVLELPRLGLPQDLPHARALELEDAERLALAEQVERLRVGERQVLHHDARARGRRDLLEGVVDERQRAQAQEVHLEQADPLDLLHAPLGRDFVAAPLVERRELGDRPRRDHDAGGVHRRVARHALEALRDAEQLGDARVVLLHLAEHGVLLERLVQRHVEHGGDLLRDPVHVRVGHVHHAADVAHHGLRLHGAEGDDLRDVLAPVLARDVVDHLAAAALAEVDVDVRQRDALGVQEALEQQVELQRVDVGDAQAVGHQAAGRRAAARARPGCPARARSG